MLLFTLRDSDDEDWSFILYIYERFQRLMYNIAVTMASDEAEDVMQETLIRLKGKTETLRSLREDRLAAYIKTAVEHTAINHINRRSTRLRRIVTDSVEELELCDPAPRPEEQLLASERDEYFYGIFARLAEEDQRLLKGKYILELNDSEMAEQIGCKPASIRMKLTRARRRALEQFQKGDYFIEQNRTIV